MKKDIIVNDINTENLKDYIYYIRGMRVMIDIDLARIYGYSTKDFNRQVKNNIEKFDTDFMFQLSDDENEILRCKNFISSWGGITAISDGTIYNQIINQLLQNPILSLR